MILNTRFSTVLIKEYIPHTTLTVVLLLSLNVYMAAQDGVGVNTDSIVGQLHITTNSTLGFPQLRLTETGNDYARIKFENTQYPGSYWDFAGITGTDTTGSARLNMYFYNGTKARDVFLMLGNGDLLRNSFDRSTYDLFYTDNSYRGGFGYDSLEFRIFTANNPLPSRIRIGTKGRNNLVVDAQGNVGIGTSPDTLSGELQITTNSSTSFPHLRLTEPGGDYARIKFESTSYPNSYWDVAGAGGTDTTGINRFNIFYNGDQGGLNLLSLSRTGTMSRFAFEDFIYDYYYNSAATYRGGIGFSGADFRLFTGGGSDGRIRIGTRGFSHVVIDTSGFVGLNVFSPQVRLHVNGKSRIEGNAPVVGFNSDGTHQVEVLNHSLAMDGQHIQSHNSTFNQTSRLYLQRYGGDVDLGGGKLVVANGGDVLISGADLRVTNNRTWLGTAEYFEDGGGNTLTLGGATLVPAVDNAYDLGSSAFRWDDVWATNGIIQTSDMRDKTDIRALDYGIDALKQLQPVMFKWSDSPEDGDKIGLIAQDIREVIPEVVKTLEHSRNEDGVMQEVELDRYGVYYTDLIPVLVNAIKDQNAFIESLQAENDTLRARQEAIIAALEEAGITVQD